MCDGCTGEDSVSALFPASLKLLAKLNCIGLGMESFCLACVSPQFHSPEMKNKSNCIALSRNSPYTMPIENVEL